MIQGPKTMLGYTDIVEVDPVHNEVFVAQGMTNSVLVFDRDARGDVAPKRIIYGPKTRLNGPQYLSVDPVNDVLVIMNEQPDNILIFNRMDQGDVAPKSVIGGPKTGLGSLARKVVLLPETKSLVVPFTKRLGQQGRRGESFRESESFVGLWKYSDNGDVPPLILVKGLKVSGAMELIPAAKELWVKGTSRPDFLHAYRVPELFE